MCRSEFRSSFKEKDQKSLKRKLNQFTLGVLVQTILRSTYNAYSHLPESIVYLNYYLKPISIYYLKHYSQLFSISVETFQFLFASFGIMKNSIIICVALLILFDLESSMLFLFINFTRKLTKFVEWFSGYIPSFNKAVASSNL